MVLRLEVDEIGYVGGGSSLCVLRIPQTRARSANSLIFLSQPVTVECAYFEVFAKQRETIIALPEPIIERR